MLSNSKLHQKFQQEEEIKKDFRVQENLLSEEDLLHNMQYNENGIGGHDEYVGGFERMMQSLSTPKNHPFSKGKFGSPSPVKSNEDRFMSEKEEELDDSDFDNQYENLDENPDDDLQIKFIKRVLK